MKINLGRLLLRYIKQMDNVESILNHSVAVDNLVLKAGQTISKEHVNLVPDKDFDPNLMGTFWERTKTAEGKSILSQIPATELSNYNFAFGGVDFDTSRHMAALHNAAKKIYPKSKWASIYPLTTREERFDAAVKYNGNKLYYADYIKDFTHKHILTRFLDDKGNLSEPKKPIHFFSFSVGAREIMMMENSLRSAFQEKYECNNNDIKALFSYMHATCVAYALDYVDLPKISFPKTVIFSVNDLGVLVPESLNQEVIANPKIWNSKIFYVKISEDPLSSPTNLFILGDATVPIIIQGNKFTNLQLHSLPHYIEGITNIAEFHDYLLNIMGDNVTSSLHSDALD